MGNNFFHDSVQYIKGVGPQRAKLLNKLGIRFVEDALYHLPYRYEDRSSLKKINRLIPGELVTVRGKVISADLIRIPRKNFTIFELTISDGSGIVKAKWFNQPFMKKVFKGGRELFLSGTIKNNPYRGVGFEIENPEYEFIEGDKDLFIHTSRIVPVYKTTSGMGQRTLRATMYHIVHNTSDKIKDYMPEDIIERNSLTKLDKAIKNIHFPEHPDVDVNSMTSEEGKYHRRLAFDELFLFQLGIARIKQGITEEKGIRFSCKRHFTKQLIDSLPFRFTASQEKVIKEIFGDMTKPRPMNRLIQGDVGCGKTVVALTAMLRAVECGYQAAIMAPTEILAQQHFFNIMNLLTGIDVKCSLLTSKLKEMGDDPDIVIGTHALIQESVSFNKLGLVIIDEQHRFGVRQRAELRKKGYNPDVLVMTATPIPRTLAMTLYGDMDYSIIDELPPGRIPVETVVVPEHNKKTVYDLISREIKKGGQAYIVYPIIEEGGKTNLRSAELGKEALRRIFHKLRIELVHGKMKPDERREIMDAFKAGNIHILVSTTVIEVGVDVPNTTVMVIVHAERFGLSQLHQLRGRVGRGKRKAYCVLLTYGGLGEDAKRRLAVMAKTSDGFKIAEEDLNIRGPGDFFGTKQSGVPDLRVVNIIRDGQLIDLTKKEAFQLLEREPLLNKYPLLKERVNRMWKGKVELFKTV